MEHKVLEQLREALHRHLAPRRHTALLTAIVALFMIRPLIGDRAIASVVFSIVLLVTLLFALYAIQVDDLLGERETLLAQRKRRSIIGWALAVPAIAERLAIIYAPSPAVYLAGTTLWLLLFIFVTWHLLCGVLRQREITSETISMSISVYLLLGFTWGLFYIVLHHLQPLAFSLGSSPTPISGPSTEQEAFPVLIYFSLTTLATIGYGDITPVTLQARYAAVAEGIMGQFYMAILVARLVGMQMSQAASRQEEHHDSNTKQSAKGD
jgi:hypothetical protein